MSCLVIIVKSDESSSRIAGIVRAGGAHKEEAIALSHYFRSLGAGTRGAASFDVHTGATDPVAASATYTLATVIATDTAVVGKTTFTYTASPTLTTDVLVTVGSAAALASTTDIDIVHGVLTKTAHGLLTGDVVQVTTSSVKPTGFALSTDYAVIKLTADTFQIAASQANAAAGVPIVPSTKGTGTQTFTPDADKSKAFRLSAAINAHASTSVIVSATSAAKVVTVTALEKSALGNQIVASSSGGTITVTGSGYLTSGAGGVISAGTHFQLGIA